MTKGHLRLIVPLVAHQRNIPRKTPPLGRSSKSWWAIREAFCWQLYPIFWLLVELGSLFAPLLSL